MGGKRYLKGIYRIVLKHKLSYREKFELVEIRIRLLETENELLKMN